MPTIVKKPAMKKPSAVITKLKVKKKSNIVTKKPAAKSHKHRSTTKKGMQNVVTKKPAAKLPSSQWIAKKGRARLAKRPRGGPTLRRPAATYTKFRSPNGKLMGGRKDRMKMNAKRQIFLPQQRLPCSCA